MPPSPRAEAIARLKAQVEDRLDNRLSQTHEDRISQLAARLHSSLQSPFDRPGAVLDQGVSSRTHALRSETLGQIKLAEVFDELLASDQAHRMAQLKDEATFREREVCQLSAQRWQHWQLLLSAMH